jgi:hypothetical protein
VVNLHGPCPLTTINNSPANAAASNKKYNMKHEKDIHIVVEIKKNDLREVTFHHDRVTGGEVKELAHVSLEERLFVFRNGDFHPVGNNETTIIKDKEHFVVVPHGEIYYSVDDEPQWTREKILTPKKIMEDAGIDPATNYLSEIKGDGQPPESFKDKPDEPIHMHDGMKFLSTFVGPKPVSNH